MNEFLASTPSVEEYSERLESYSGVVTDLSAHTPPARLGWLSVDTAPMRRALAKEASKWQQCFGEAFVEWIGHQVGIIFKLVCCVVC